MWKVFCNLVYSIISDDVAFGAFLLDIARQLQQEKGCTYCCASVFCSAFFHIFWKEYAFRWRWTRTSEMGVYLEKFSLWSHILSHSFIFSSLFLILIFAVHRENSWRRHKKSSNISSGCITFDRHVAQSSMDHKVLC